MAKINIEFLEEEIEVIRRMDAEHYATGYFKELGYKVHFSKKIFADEKMMKRHNSCRSNNPRLAEIYFLYDDYPGVEECIHDPLGIPDLVLFKNGKFIFVEVKTGGDGIRSDQLKWMGRHNNIDIILFYLNQKIIKK